MSFNTPFEIALDRELARVKIPFLSREVIHEQALKEWEQYLSVRSNEAGQHQFPELVKKRQALLNWDRALIHRQTAAYGNNLYVMYDVFPSPDQVAVLKSSSYDELPEAVDSMLAQRLFICEAVSIYEDKKFDEREIHEKSIGNFLVHFGRESSKEIAFELLNNRRLYKKTEFTKAQKAVFSNPTFPLVLWYEYPGSGGICEPFTSVRGDISSNIVKGMDDPVQAPELAWRIAEFVRNYEKK